MTLRRLAIVLLFVCSGLVMGCASKESIVTGSWTGTMNQDGRNFQVYVEFFSDKSVTFKCDGNPLASGKWIILDDGRVKADGDMAFVFLTGGSPTILGEISNRSCLVLNFGKNGKASFAKLSLREAQAQADADAHAPTDAAQAQTGAARALTEARLRVLESALTTFRMGTGGYPATLASLLNNDGTPNWSGPYMNGNREFADAWGTPFAYERKGKTFEIISAGPDRIAGSADDIKQ